MSTKVMIVEGEDETSFFKTFCRQKDLPQFRYIDVGGKSKIKENLKLLLNERDADSLETIIIVQDADKSHANTLQSLQQTVKNQGLPVPDDHMVYAANDDIRIGFYIMPGNECEGMLEDLLLQSVENSPVKLEAESYISKLIEVAKEGKIEPPSNLPKARLHAYLAGLKKHKKNIGIATQAGCFDLDSDALEPLKNFLNGA